MTTTTHTPVLDRPRVEPPSGSTPASEGSGGSPAPSQRDPRWVRPAFVSLLLATAVLYLWNLSASGTANSYYAAAVQAGSQSWKAWFFGALDQASSITVDKPPASLWVAGLSARVFGFNSWSLLVPQALEGVAAVALLVATVRRVAGPVAGLTAGALLALTPAAVLIFRFDNPDALLVLLVVAATYAVTRALESGRTRWLLLAGVALGFGFLTKSGQALLVLPALGAAYLALGPHGLLRRLRQLVLAFATLVVAAGWWIVTVLLWPASARPYMGGSTDNNPLELAFGYNGLGRLFGGSGNGGGGGGGAGGGGQNTSFGGSTGLLRMFHGEFGLEIAWLLPAALICLVGLAWVTRRAPRRDPLRAAALVWGASLLVTGLVFSFMKGTIHPYYSVALAPSIAALVAIGTCELWRRRTHVSHAVLLTAVAASAAYGAWTLRDNGGSAFFVTLVAVVGALAVGLLALRWAGARRPRHLLPAVAVVAALAIALPFGSWGLRTAGTAHSGSIPTAVTTSASGQAGGQPGGQTGDQGGPGGTQGGTPPNTSSGTRPTGARPTGGGGTAGGGASTSSALTKALKASTTTWSAATVGAQSAASLELASNTSVIAIGGFSGSDQAPTLAQFEAWVASGQIHYFIAGGGQGGGAGGTSSVASQITSWVEAHYTANKIAGTTVYDLTSASS